MSSSSGSSSLLRDWDDASKSRRKKLLEWFQSRFQHAEYSSDLERACGTDGSLLLARVLVWMHKTTAAAAATANTSVQCYALSEQLACVQIFLSSANVHKHYRAFEHANGLSLLVHVLQLDSAAGVSDADRCVVLLLLQRIAKCGRAYKEAISRAGGELAIVRCALAGSSKCSNSTDTMPLLWTACRDALLEQLVGNTNGIESGHAAIVFMLEHSDAEILRHVISPHSFYRDVAYCRAKQTALVPLAVAVLQARDLRLQHEGLELVHALLQTVALQPQICAVLADWLQAAAVATEPVDERFARVQRSREYEAFAHVRSPFVHAAQSLSSLMQSTPSILPILTCDCEILVPLAFVLVVERAQSLKWLAAAVAIHFAFTSDRQIFAVSEAKLLVCKATNPPDDLAHVLVPSDAHQQRLAQQFYRNSWRRVPNDIDANGNSNVDADDDAELQALEQEVDDAVRDFVPELQTQQMRNCYDPDADARELYGDAMDVAHEQQLRTTLERHFQRFRSCTSVDGVSSDVATES